MRRRLSPAEAEWQSLPIIAGAPRRRPLDMADIASMAGALVVVAAALLALAF